MAISITIDAVDHTGSARLESIVLVEMAEAGEIGQGGFNRDDVALDDVPALKDVTVEEDEDVGDERMFTGVVGIRGLERGPFRQQTNRQWDVNLWDLNAVLDDEIFQSDGANRPEETDFARVSWLLTTSAMAALGVTAGVIPNTNTVTLDATDYRGQGPRQVLDDAASAAQKNYFVYDWGAGAKLYYDRHDGTSLSSTLRISTVLTDIDNTVTFAAENPKLDLDPSQIYSKIRFKYDGGVVWVEDAGTATAYRRREVSIEDLAVKTSAKATAKATAYLDAHATEQQTLTLAVSLPAAQVNDIRAGQRIQVKLPHLDVAEATYDDWTWKRITRREIRARPGEGGVSSESYTLALEFAEPRLVAGSGGSDTADEDTATVVEGAAVTLVRFKLEEEIGGGPFTNDQFNTTTSILPDFDFGPYASTTPSQIRRRPEQNVTHPFTDCGIGGGASGGLINNESWFRFQIDLSDDTLVGVQLVVAPLSNVVGFAALANSIIVGIHTGTDSLGVEVTAQGQWVECGRVGGTDGGSVFIPRSLLIDDGTGYCWAVLAPGWLIDPGLLICVTNPKPEGYAEAGVDATPLVSLVKVNLSGSGLSPWVPVDGDVDGTNDTYTLLSWDGTGVPEVRVGATELAASEFTYDTTALTVTLVVPPPADMAGQVAARYNVGS